MIAFECTKPVDGVKEAEHLGDTAARVQALVARETERVYASYYADAGSPEWRAGWVARARDRVEVRLATFRRWWKNYRRRVRYHAKYGR